MAKLTGEDAVALVTEMRKICHGLAAMPEDHAMRLASQAVGETNRTIKALEDRIAEAGCIPGDVCGVLLHYGAVSAILEDLPATNDRRELVAAGREIGKMLAAEYGRVIRERLDKKNGGN